VQNSASNNLLRILNDATHKIGNENIDIFPTANGTSVAVNGRGLIISTNASSQSTGAVKIVGTSSVASDNNWSLWLTHSFTPLSGTATHSGILLNQTINQMGGANGITRGLYVNPTLTAAADWRSIEWSNNTGWGLYGAGTANNYLAGSLGIGTTTLNNSALRVNKAVTGAVTQSSIANSSTINSDVTSNAWMYVSTPSTQAAAFTISEVVHFNAFNLTVGAGSAVTNNIGFKATSSLTGATNNWGFYGDIASGTGRWNLYMNGTAANYLAGSLGIGATTNLTSRNLSIVKNITGSATAYSVVNDSQVQSDVTGNATGFFNGINTANTTFTLNNYMHFDAVQGTIGASSTVTNQYGFRAASSLTGATNNFGFRGDIAAATGRWNFYANGTALNYFNGNTIMGTLAADSGEKLQVNGTMKVTGASTFSSSVTSTQFRLSALNTAPTSSTDTGTLGEIRIDANYIYICTTTNTWKRVAIATW
jgi:hypothetical protein